MAFYDYRCSKCESEFEVTHGMMEKPRVKCPECGSKASKMPSACGIVVHGGCDKMRDSIVRNTEAKQDLLENYGVEGVTPLAGNNFESTYKEIKESGSMVRDQMQKTVAVNEAKKKIERREWAIKANKRVGERTRKAAKMKAKEAAEKRAVKISS